MNDKCPDLAIEELAVERAIQRFAAMMKMVTSSLIARQYRIGMAALSTLAHLFRVLFKRDVVMREATIGKAIVFEKIARVSPQYGGATHFLHLVLHPVWKAVRRHVPSCAQVVLSMLVHWTERTIAVPQMGNVSTDVRRRSCCGSSSRTLHTTCKYGSGISGRPLDKEDAATNPVCSQFLNDCLPNGFGENWCRIDNLQVRIWHVG